MLSKQFIFFIITGGLAALVNIASRIIINKFTSYSVSIVLAYCLGMISAFYLNKVFVFTKSINSTRKSFLLFSFVNVIAILQTWGVSILLAFYILPLIDIREYADDIAHVIGVIIPVFTSYLGHKYLTFKSTY